jgi:enoyl-[acyl-carrier protein] reductase I
VGLFSGKKGIVMGIANQHSLATAVAEFLHKEGAEMGFSHLPDEKGRMEARLRKVVDRLEPKLIKSCDANKDEDVQDFFGAVKETYGQIDFFVHSIAFAPSEDIRCATIDASRAGFLTAMETSCYSLMATAREARKVMGPGGSMVTMSYFGGEKVVAGYNLMGVVKAALESAVGYLAYDLGADGIRINAVSAGPVKTLAASAIGGFSQMLNMNAGIAPLGRNVTGEEVAKASAFLLSDLSSATTGEVLHVDGGYNIMGNPGRGFQRWGVDLSNLNKVEP